MKQPKVALIHDYLVQYGGAEKTLESICDLFPDADIFTGIYEPDRMSDQINSKTIFASESTVFKIFPKHLTFLMPLVFENFNLDVYDMVISDGTAWPKGVITNPDQLHISYIHTPPRFLYKYSVETTKRNAWYFKPFVSVIDHFLRIWDYAAAQRPDYLLTNSQETQGRIKKFYNRDATVIYPPVEVSSVVDENLDIGIDKPFFLALGRLAAYKNFDLLIKAFNMLDIELVIAGTGPEKDALSKLIGENIQMLGMVTQEMKHALLKSAIGLINTVQDEDFGIVPIEAISHGTPVLVFKAGGHLETVKENINGMFFDSLEPKKLAKSVEIFHKKVLDGVYNPKVVKKSAQQFSDDRFKREFLEFVMSKWKEKHA